MDARRNSRRARRQVVQWQGDNVAAVERLVSQHHLARADKEADKLRIVGIGLNVEINLGDSVILDGDRLGIQRAATEQPLAEEFVSWTGENLHAIAEFLNAYVVRVELRDGKVNLYGGDSLDPWFTLRRGDRLVKRDGQIIVSIAGKDHRH